MVRICLAGLLMLSACGRGVAIEVEHPATRADAQRAPLFTATDHRGQPVSLAADLAHGPVVLVFYRGHW